MSAYPKLVLKSEDTGVWVLAPGFNPQAVVRTLREGRQVGPGGVSLGGVIAQLDLREWEQVEDLNQFFQPAEDRDGARKPEGGTAPSSAALERALAWPLRGLVGELYYKKPHFVGPGGFGFSREHHDRILARLDRPGWLDVDSDADPFSALLAEVHALRFGAGMPEETAHRLAKWERVESTINARFRAVCELVGPKALSEVIATFASDWAPVPPLSVTSMKAYLPGPRSDGQFGQPDLLFEGVGILVLVEMKVRGGTARAKYAADQFFKYLRFAEDARRRYGSTLRTLHVLTAPTGAGRVISNSEAWLTQPPVHGADLQLDFDGLLTSLSPKRRAEAMALGGTDWLKGAAAQMPCRFVDLRTLIAALGSSAPPTPTASRELARQLAACSAYGCPCD